MKKHITVAVLIVGLFISPAFTEAASLTSAQVQAILGLLSSFGADSATIAKVNATLTGASSPSGRFCYSFNYDLSVGTTGEGVSSLNSALAVSGVNTSGNTSIFDENTAADVVSFQAKYGIRQTGYVGPMTRAKLNSLYGCSNPVQPPVIQPPTVCPSWGCGTAPVSPVTPTITGVSSSGTSNGQVITGQTVYLTGSGLRGQVTINLGGVFVSTLSAYSSDGNHLSFVFPSSGSKDVVQISVTNAAGLTSNVYLATVLPPAVSTPSPTITNVMSKAADPGQIYVGETSYISGSGFLGNVTVTVGGVAVPTAADGDAYFGFVVPNLPAGPTTLTVTNFSGGTSNAFPVTVIVPTSSAATGTTQCGSSGYYSSSLGHCVMP